MRRAGICHHYGVSQNESGSARATVRRSTRRRVERQSRALHAALTFPMTTAQTAVATPRSAAGLRSGLYRECYGHHGCLLMLARQLRIPIWDSSSSPALSTARRRRRRSRRTNRHEIGVRVWTDCSGERSETSPGSRSAGLKQERPVRTNRTGSNGYERAWLRLDGRPRQIEIEPTKLRFRPLGV